MREISFLIGLILVKKSFLTRAYDQLLWILLGLMYRQKLLH